MESKQVFTGRGRYSRREFVAQVSFIGIGNLAFSNLSAFADSNIPQNYQTGDITTAYKDKKKLGIALVGLGTYSEEELAPALQQTRHCYLAGIVTGSPDKIDTWINKYQIPSKNVYNYNNFDSIKDNPDIAIVYVVLPNALHAEFTIRAAQAGKNVICEKPMAVTVEECDRMIEACKNAGKKLSIGYRLHFEPHSKEIMRLGQENIFGNIKILKAKNGMSDVKGWRLNKKLAGGGPLMDVGIYCVQAVRYTTGMEPVAVTAIEGPKTNPDIFKEVEESLTWRLEFPNNIIAECKSSYSEDLDTIRAEATKGWFELAPAYAYRGIKGQTSEGKIEFKQVNQQALQMDDFALAIQNNRPSPVPGEMGRQDVKILQAIYKSMNSGQRVVIT